MPRYIGAYRGGVRPSAPTTVYRTCALSLPCHSEPVTDVTGVGIRPPSPPSQREVSRPKAVTEGEICRGIRGDAGIAPYVPSTENVCVSHRTDRVVRPYTRFPSGKCIIKTKPAAKGRHLPLPLRGKGAI